jgi:tetratricopeptide (TPR) repeat protein
MYQALLRLPPQAGNAEVPSQAEISMAQADAYTGLAKYEEARKTLQAAGTTQAPLMKRLALLDRVQARFSEAERLLTDTLAALDKSGPAASAEIPATLVALADVYRATGRHAQALAFYEKARAGAGPGAVLASALEGMGSIARAENRWPEATTRLTEALQLRTQALGPAHPAVAQVRLALGRVARDQRAFAEAKEHFDTALNRLEEVFENFEHPVITEARFELAQLHAMEGRYTEAQTELESVLSSRSRVLGAAHPDVADTKDALGALYRAQGQHQKAEQEFKEAFRIRQKTLGENHPDVARSRQNLAGIYREQHQYASAAKEYREALAELENSALPEMLLHSELNHNLATVYQAQGNQKEAEQAYLKAIAIRKRLAPKDPQIRIHGRALASLYLEHHEFQKAVSVLEPLAEQVRAGSGTASPEYDSVLGQLAEAYRGIPRLAEADRVLRQQLAMRAARSGADTADILVNLADVSAAQGDFAAAVGLYEKVLEAQKGSGAGPLAIAETRYRFGQALFAMRDLSGAVGQFTECLALREQQLKPFDAEVTQAALRLGESLAGMREYRKAAPYYERVLRAQEETLTASDPEIARTLIALSGIRLSMGQMETIEADLRRALEIVEKGAASPNDAAAAYIALARFQSLRGKLGESRNSYEQARLILERAGELQGDALIPALEGIAEIERRRNRLRDAESALRQSLAIQEKKLKPDPLTLAMTHNDLAITLAQRGSYKEAEEQYRRSLSTLEQSGARAESALSLANLGDLYRVMRKYGDADARLREARGVLAKEPAEAAARQSAYVQEKAGALAIDRQQFPQAESELNGALRTYEQLYGPASQQSARVLLELGRLYEVSRDYTKADTHYRQAIAAYRQIGGAAAPELVPALERYAVLLRLRRRDAEARNARTEAADLRTRLGMDSPQ